MNRLFIFILIVSLSAPLSRVKAQATACKPSDSMSVDIVAAVRAIMTANNPVRTSLSLPLVSSSDVRSVTDEPTCARVRQALDSLTLTTNPNAVNLGPRQIYVVKLGSFYAALNPNSTMGEWRPLHFFNDLVSYVSLMTF